MITVNITYSLFKDLSISANGGALQITLYSPLFISHSLFSNCQAAGSGGAIFSSSYSIILEDTCFDQCKSYEALAMKTMRLEATYSSSDMSRCSAVGCSQLTTSLLYSCTFFIVQYKSVFKESNISRSTIYHVAAINCDSDNPSLSKCDHSYVHLESNTATSNGVLCQFQYFLVSLAYHNIIGNNCPHTYPLIRNVEKKLSTITIQSSNFISNTAPYLFDQLTTVTYCYADPSNNINVIINPQLSTTVDIKIQLLQCNDIYISHYITATECQCQCQCNCPSLKIRQNLVHILNIHFLLLIHSK